MIHIGHILITLKSLHCMFAGMCLRWYERPGGKAWLAKHRVSFSASLWGRLRTRDLGCMFVAKSEEPSEELVKLYLAIFSKIMQNNTYIIFASRTVYSPWLHSGGQNMPKLLPTWFAKQGVLMILMWCAGIVHHISLLPASCSFSTF